MFRAHVLLVRRAKLYYTASGIITPIGVMIPEAAWYMFRHYRVILRELTINTLPIFYVLLTVYLSIILVINQLNAQNLVL